MLQSSKKHLPLICNNSQAPKVEQSNKQSYQTRKLQNLLKRKGWFGMFASKDERNLQANRESISFGISINDVI